jgi:uncharacterized membrane protein YhdT
MRLTDDDRASWAFVEGSISVSASILIAYAMARCNGCVGLPVVGFFETLTEQDGGVIITGMALLFPTALAFYLGVKMIIAAYRDYKRWRDNPLQEAREEGRVAERRRIKRELKKRGISLPPEAARIFSGESDHRS